MISFDLELVLPQFLPAAIAWAEFQSQQAAIEGNSLDEKGQRIAKQVGVRYPEIVRIKMVDQLPLPADRQLREAALQAGLLGPGMVGLTLGHSILIVRGNLGPRLLSHECRHVYQYESYGSIAAFTPVYLWQIATFRYQDAPMERDARIHELSD